MQDLRADTVATILMGPAVAVTDGVTPVTDVTLAGADHAKLMKHDGTVLVDLTSDSRTFTHKEGGWYTLVLGVGDIDTEGRLTVLIMDTDKCLPFWKDFMVLSKAAYDSKYIAKASGYMDINVKTIGETATPHTSGKLHVLDDEGNPVANEADILFLRKIEQGRWKVVGNQMIFYEEDNETPLLTFDLKDKNGQPTMANPYERTPV